MSLVITGDLSWSGDLVLFLEALDGGPAADVAGYDFASSGDIEYSATVPEPVDPEDRLLGLYRCVTKTAGGVIAGAGYVTIGTATAAVRIRSEQAVELDSVITDQLNDIEDAVNTYISGISAAVDGSAATIVGFPETLVIGDSYTTDGSNAIHVFVRDSNDDPVTAVGTHEFTDSDFAPEVIITTSGRAGRVRASVAWVPGGSEGYLKIQIPLSESHRAAPGAATVQVVLKWTGCEKTIATQTVTWIPRI